MSIEEMKAAKLELEAEILTKIRAFEIKTGVEVTYVRLQDNSIQNEMGVSNRSSYIEVEIKL